MRLIGCACVMLCASAASAQCESRWVTGIGAPGANAEVRAMTVMPNGDVVAGGSFVEIGPQLPAPNKLARYSVATGTWTAPPTGNNTRLVHALASLPDGDLLVGGNFNSIGGVATRQFARYNFETDTWSGLGYGNNGGQVNAILVLPGGTDVIIGGNIPRIAGVVANHIGRLHIPSGVWTPMGSNFVSTGDVVNDLALAPDGTVIVGGVFLDGPGIGALRIARYHPATNTWSTLGSGLNNAVAAVLVLPDGDVLAGGYFTMAGAVPVSRVARYNPASNTWSDMGGGVSGGFEYVNDLELLPGGDVVVGGSFTVAGGVGAARVARYSPATNTWSSMGAGTNQDVTSVVTLPVGDVVVGGFFTQAGGVGAARIARYAFGGTVSSISQHPQDTCVALGSEASFTVVASGSEPITYQWRKDGDPIDASLNPSAATSTLALPGVEESDEGSYDCVVTNSCNSATSDGATLMVDGCPQACDPDVNCDGSPDQGDVACMVLAVAGDVSCICQDPDFNQDGSADQGDVAVLIVVVAGQPCP